jgi:GDPmannose 4,6-dehydratase
MLQQNEPDDYVVGTGVTHSVQDLVEVAFGHAGLDWKEFVKEDPKFRRPAEVEQLQADPSKAKRQLDWEPTVTFEQLITMMVDADLERLGNRG